MVQTAEAIVIGGGIFGASTAYYLTKLGFGKVLVLEKSFLASGSTGHSAANVRQHYFSEVAIKLAKRAVELFSRFDEELGYPCGFEQVGYMILAKQEDVAKVKQVVEAQKKLGIEANMVSLEDIRELVPQADLHQVLAGCYEKKSGYADPRATVYALIHRAVELGAKVYQHTEVVEIRLKGDRVTGIVTNQGEISAPIIINCAGPWAAKVGKMVGIQYSLRFTREIDVKVQLPANYGMFPVTCDSYHGSYVRPQAVGFAVAGLTFPEKRESCDPDNYLDKATSVEVEMISNKVIKRMPRFGEGLPVAGWAGVYSITDDWYPIVGDYPGLKGYYQFIGGSGHGFKIAPPIGEALADIIAGKSPAIDISPLRFSRFQEGEMFKSPWGPGPRG